MPTKTKLTDGDDVMIELDEVCYPEQVFSRVGPNILAGIVSNEASGRRHGIYLWHNVEGVYHYVGDIVLSDGKYHGIEMQINAHIPLTDILEEQKGKKEFSAAARTCLLNSVSGLESTFRVPNHVHVLARAEAATHLPPAM